MTTVNSTCVDRSRAAPEAGAAGCTWEGQSGLSQLEPKRPEQAHTRDRRLTRHPSPGRPQSGRRPCVSGTVTSFGHSAQCPRASFLRVLSLCIRPELSPQPASQPLNLSGTKMSLSSAQISWVCCNKPLIGSLRQQECVLQSFRSRQSGIKVVPPAGAGGGPGLSLSQSLWLPTALSVLGSRYIAAV